MLGLGSWILAKVWRDAKNNFELCSVVGMAQDSEGTLTNFTEYISWDFFPIIFVMYNRYW